MDHPRNLHRNKRDIGEPASKLIRGLMSPESGKALMNPFAAFLSQLGIPIDESFHNSPKHVVLSSYPTDDGVLYQGIMADAGVVPEDATIDEDGDEDYAGFEDMMIEHHDEEEESAEQDDMENKLESMISEIRESLSEASSALHDLTDSYDEARRK